jgi:hypothetical protein
MPKRPYRAYVVANPKGGSENKKAFWREVGVAWPHKKADGFTVDLHEGISVSGRIVCIAPKAAKKEVRDVAGAAWFTLSESDSSDE